MAEVSNPFIIIRTMLKIAGKKETKLYAVNELVFATIFLTARVGLTPLAGLWLLEGDNCIMTDKLGTLIVLYIQNFWSYKILYNIAEKVKNVYAVTESKDKEIPSWVTNVYNFFWAINFNK